MVYHGIPSIKFIIFIPYYTINIHQPSLWITMFNINIMVNDDKSWLMYPIKESLLRFSGRMGLLAPSTIMTIDV